MGQSRFAVVSRQNTEFILVLSFMNHCIIYHANNCNLLPPHPVCSFELVERAPAMAWLP